MKLDIPPENNASIYVVLPFIYEATSLSSSNFCFSSNSFCLLSIELSNSSILSCKSLKSA